MHPGDVLGAAGDRAPDAHPKRREHLRQCPAALGEHDSGPRRGHARPELLRTARLVLPGDHHFGQEVAARGRSGLVHLLVPARAVEPAGGLGDQHAGARVGGPETLHEVACPKHPRVADLALRRLAPALVHGLAEQVHNAVAARERVCGGRLGLGVGPETGFDGRAEPLTRPVRITGERDHAVAALLKGADDRGPDRSGGSGNRDPHARQYATRVSWRGPRATPLRMASRETASATAWLTSRLKTDIRCPDVECAAEDAGERQDVVDLVRVVGAPRGHHAHVRRRRLGRDLGIGVRHREDDRVGVHAPEVLGLDQPGPG